MATNINANMDPEKSGNAFLFRNDVEWGDTIKNCFIPKRQVPQNGRILELPAQNKHYLCPTRTKNMAIACLGVFALALIVVAIAIAAILCPPVGAVVGSLVALSGAQLMAVAGVAALIGIVGLVLGAAAADKLRHGWKDTKRYAKEDNPIDNLDGYTADEAKEAITIIVDEE